jgi:hypothetical protein
VLSWSSTANSVSFTTAGGALVMLLPDEWDPEQAHILSMNVTAALNKPNIAEQPQFEVLFEGQLPIPYSPTGSRFQMLAAPSPSIYCSSIRTPLILA